jgi:16S rRNA (cytidine1402-2'-O)-methyltransferase
MTLLLLPNLLAENKHHEIFLPSSVDKAVSTLDGLISESDKGGKRFLSHFKRHLPSAIYNKKTAKEEIDFLLEPLKNGERWGYVSDCGLPCVADPGSELVKRARELGIPVQAFVGPSSLTLALMLSGLPSQQFSFHGYLKGPEQLERLPRGYVHIFIEAPHHNDKMLETLIDQLNDHALLCTATDLTLPSQMVITQKVKTWKSTPKPNLHKRPTLFLFLM